jgi:NAD(P)-dependent dehydrogenase (short-subunit alcohol dehydrogenase family)
MGTTVGTAGDGRLAEGARVVATDLDADGLESLAHDVGGTLVTQTADVASEEDARATVALAEARYGGLDVLVANAGIIPLGTLADSSLDDWDPVDGGFLAP